MGANRGIESINTRISDRRSDRLAHAGSPMVALLLAAMLSVATFVGSAAPVAAADHSAATLASADAKAPDGRLIVVWRKPVAASVAARIAGVSREQRGPDARRSLVIAEPGQAAAVAARLRADPAVASVTVDSIRQLSDFPTTPPNDPYFATYQTDLVKMGVPTAWLTTTGSTSQVVAVLDTGMDRSHPDLDAVPVVSPWNAITGTIDVADTDGHGTHVIGEIAAETNNGEGIAGIAPGVTIMPIKVCGDIGCFTSDVDDGIDWARMHGATVINMSLAGPSSSGLEQSIITNAYNAGITIVAAAGNSGDGTVNYPASYANVLSVAATDNDDLHASFSSFNASVDLAAPGVDILSTFPGGYAFADGTSMSSPHVAAVAALVRSAHPLFTPAQVEQALRATAVDLGAAGRDDVFGSGRVDAAAAVAYSSSTPPPPPPPPPTIPTLFTIQAGQSITLRQPGTPGAVFDFEASPDLAVWHTITTRVIGSGAYVDFTITPAQTAYYRSTFSDGSTDPFRGVVVPDTTRPTITRKTPTASKTGVDRDGNIKVTFSEKVLHVSKTTVRLVNNTTGAVLRLRSFTYNATTHVLTLDPYARLTALKTYRVEVRAGITDVAGNTLAAKKWTFKTGRR